MNKEQDYVLGTHDDEIARLGFQHRLWRPRVSELWRQVGVRAGLKIVDIGAGPGFATADLAELVGPTGSVTAVERLARYLESAKARCRQTGLDNVTFVQSDLMKDDLHVSGMDVAWCRWVAIFVPDVAKLVRQIAGTLRPGGLALFHEYVDYHTLRLNPRVPSFEEFSREVDASWRDQGGDPDVGVQLPTHLVNAGFRLIKTEPVIYCASPQDVFWQWPSTWVDTYVYRLVDLGRVDKAWAEKVRADFHAAEKNPASRIFTPMMLEIVAEKVG